MSNDFFSLSKISYNLAKQNAKEKSRKPGTLMNIAVVDEGTNLIAFVYEDGSWLCSIDISQRKARTARYFSMDSGEIGKLSQPGGSLYNI
jgi:uncharacterized protein GlcG (DUF336 family)